jgi:hypothetical protein
VVTCHGETRIVEWIGQTRKKTQHGTYDNVEILAHALDQGVPSFPLQLSPHQYIFVCDARIKVSDLINDATIFRIASSVSTPSFVLDRHDTLILNNLGVDSFIGPPNVFTNFHDYKVWYPEQRDYVSGFGNYVHSEAPLISQLRFRNIGQAEGLGFKLSSDPAARLIVGHKIVHLTKIDNQTLRASVDAPFGRTYIVSRASTPADLEPAKRDTRRLGIAFKEITLHEGDKFVRVQHDDPRLRSGFHRPELNWRWTNGCGELPAHLFQAFQNRVHITIHLAPITLNYLAPNVGLVADT